MKTIILAGGLGTRLREETEFKPKPMVLIGKYPIIWHIMKIYSTYEQNNFIICAGYKGEQIKEYFRNIGTSNLDFTINLGPENSIELHEEPPALGWSVTIADTGNSASTTSRIIKVKKYLNNETFMCTYGDGLSDINIKKLINFHRSHGKIATVTCIHQASRFGKLQIGSDGLVQKFEEKPLTTDWVNGGFFVFEPEIFDYLSDDMPLEEGAFSKLVEDAELVAYQHDGYWQSMDTYREVLLLNEIWESGLAPWKVWN